MSTLEQDFPRRVFLDSSCLQNIQAYGEFIFDGAALQERARIHRVPHGVEDLEALRVIFAIGQRAPFELALSEGSFSEVTAKGDPSYLDWANEVLAYWHQCLDSSGLPDPASTFADALRTSKFGYLSKKDARLIRDAVIVGCDVFLTMDRRLAENHEHLQRELDLRVLTPASLWKSLRPWAGLFL